MVSVFAYMAYSGNPNFGLMALLVMLIGTDHPPTSDDNAPIGWFRMLLGYTSLIIPIVCMTPKVIFLE